MDCTKAVSNMTPGEAASCAAGPLRNLGEQIAQITLGQWFAVAVILIAVPAMFFSWVMPFFFPGRLIGRYWQGDTYTNTKEGDATHAFWWKYLCVIGFLCLVVGQNETFTIYQGLWMMFIGICILFAGPEWWGIRRDAKGQSL